MFMILPNHPCDSIVIIYVFIYYIVFGFITVREQLKELTKQYDKSENDLKALQSVGQVSMQYFCFRKLLVEDIFPEVRRLLNHMHFRNGYSLCHLIRNTRWLRICKYVKLGWSFVVGLGFIEYTSASLD
jgi:hypothetical protein